MCLRTDLKCSPVATVVGVGVASMASEALIVVSLTSDSVTDVTSHVLVGATSERLNAVKPEADPSSAVSSNPLTDTISNTLSDVASDKPPLSSTTGVFMN